MRLYNALTKQSKPPIPANQAEIIMNLLHSFGDVDLARPETYGLLIDYLGHDLLPIRGLAHWHLVRLVPQGRKIDYDPLAPKEKRAAAVEEWRKLVPAGKLPPPPQPEEKKEK
jgi:hypothetical protein